MATTPTVGAHYYMTSETTPTVRRCIGLVGNSTSQAILVTGEDYVVANFADLVRVPTTAQDVVAWLKKADTALAAGDVDGGRALIASILQWARGVPGN